MIKRFFTMIVLLLAVNAASGQAVYPDEKNEAAPRTALVQVQKEYQQALKEENFPLLMQSLIRQIKYQGLIDMDSVPHLLERLEAYIPTHRQVVEQSILHSLMAELYDMCYQNRLQARNDRTPITGYIPRNMNEWTNNIYIEKIFQHALDAVKARAALDAVNCMAYKEILILGKNSPALRPTLYDFLVYRSIDLLNRRYRVSEYFKQTVLTNNELLGSVEEFINMPIETPRCDIQPNIARLYQLLLQTQRDAGRVDALLISDLARVTFVYRNLHQLDKDSLYIASLEQLAKKYSTNPYSVEVLANMAQFYLNFRVTNFQPEGKTRASDHAKVLQICREGIQKFPGYFRINILKDIIANLETPSVNYSILANVYPGQNQKVRLNFKNISTITLTLYRIQEKTLAYLNADPGKLTREEACSRTYRLPKNSWEGDTLLQLPIEKTGLYQLVVNTTGEMNGVDPVYFSSSRLSGFARETGDRTYNVLTCDLQSGKPIPGAKVKIYKQGARDEYSLFTTVVSNADGLAIIKDVERSYLFQVSSGDDNQGVANQFPYQYFNSQRRSDDQVNLFTDRAVYRPGQTVYFSGICWDADSSGSRAIEGRKCSVALVDDNRQEVYKQEYTTNSFGSFAGNFVLPQKVLNGNFTLVVGNTTRDITVAEYKRPKFEITFNPLTEGYKLGDRLTVSGSVKSFSGVNLKDCKISYTIQENAPSRWGMEETPMQAGMIQSDAKGVFQISFSTTLDTMFRAYPINRGWGDVYLIKVSVTAPGGETQDAEYRVNVGMQRYQLNAWITPEINKNKPVKFNIIVQNNNGYTLTKNIAYSLSSLAPLPAIGASYDIQNLPVNKEVLRGTLFSGQMNELVLNLAFYPSGAYVMTFRGTGEDQDVVTQQVIYLYSPQDKQPPYLTYNWVVEEKTTCVPGEDAKIILGSSAKEVYVLYEIYADRKFMTRKRFLLVEGNTTLSIPYLDAYGETAEVVISYVKDGRFFNNNIRLTRKEENPHLDIVTKTFRDHLVPGQQEEWSFILNNAQGQPVMAEMMASMYDAALDPFQKNEWFFNPAHRPFHTIPRWFLFDYPQYHALDFRVKGLTSIVPFEFDRLNLYDLRRGDLYSTEDLGNPMTRKNAATKFYLRGYSEEGASASGQAYGILADGESREMTPISAQMGTSGILPSPQIRQNFQETAFFYPQLVTDSRGRIVVKFTVPESTTTWRFMALAHTRTMQFGQIEKSVITSKEFMISTNMPRFVRTGDHVVLQATIHNFTRQGQQGDAYLELFNPSTGTVLSKQTVPFNVPTEGDQTVSFAFTAPEDVELLGCRVVATSPRFSDGEQHVLPVVPDATLVTRSLPLFTTQKGEQTFTLQAPQGVKPYRFTLELTANPAWYAVLALPSINVPQTDNVTDLTASYYVSTLARAIATANPGITAAIREWSQHPKSTLTSPLEKNQELKSVVLQLSPWMTEARDESEQTRSLQELLDVNRQNYTGQQALNKLAELQNADGGWSWFKGFTSSAFMTENVLDAMARLTSTGATDHPEQVKRMQISALGFLDHRVQDAYRDKREAGYPEVLYLYTRSAYRDIPLAEALAAHKYYLNILEKSWIKLSLHEKALMAMTLYRHGRTDTAKRILQSLKEYATITPGMGMFWANNRSMNFTNSTIQTHVAILSAFHEVEGKSRDTELMKQWLLRQKQTQSWGSTPATVDAIYALLLTGENLLTTQENLSVKLGNKSLPLTQEGAKLGYIKQSFSAKEITPKMMNVTLTKTTSQASWGGLYLQYFEKLGKITPHAGGVSIQKQLFVQKNDGHGNTLVPLKGQSLKVGDKVNIRISVQVDQDMQFVHLKDLRAGCMEPTEQLSGNRWQNGILFYQESTDVATNFFFDFLPKGTHVFEYTVWVAQSGTYQDGVSSLQCIYAPEFSSNSSAESITVQ